MLISGIRHNHVNFHKVAFGKYLLWIRLIIIIVSFVLFTIYFMEFILWCLKIGKRLFQGLKIMI